MLNNFFVRFWFYETFRVTCVFTDFWISWLFTKKWDLCVPCVFTDLLKSWILTKKWDSLCNVYFHRYFGKLNFDQESFTIFSLHYRWKLQVALWLEGRGDQFQGRHCLRVMSCHRQVYAQSLRTRRCLQAKFRRVLLWMRRHWVHRCGLPYFP